MIKEANCKEWVQSLPKPKGEFASIQKIGRESMLNKGLPSKHTEDWRLTNFKHLEKILSLPIADKENKVFNNTFFPKSKDIAVRIDIDHSQTSVDDISLPKGIKIMSTEELKNTIDQTIKIKSNSNDLPIYINHATTQNILGLKLKGKELPPIELFLSSTKHCLSPTRIILILEEDSILDLLQVITGNDNSAHNHLLEIYLNKNSTLNHKLITLGDGEESKLLTRISVKQKKYSNYSLNSIQQGWSFSRFEPQVFQVEGEAKTSLKGLQIASGNEQVATHSLVRFEGPNGILEQLQKAISNNSSHSIFNGIIEVPKEAQKTQASQLSRNLILSKRARIDTKPELEIVADDVKCTHGATVSQLQEEELFYLMSRGISNKNASCLLIKGFYDEIINNLSLNNAQSNYINKIIMD